MHGAASFLTRYRAMNPSRSPARSVKRLWYSKSASPGFSGLHSKAQHREDHRVESSCDHRQTQAESRPQCSGEYGALPLCPQCGKCALPDRFGPARRRSGGGVLRKTPPPDRPGRLPNPPCILPATQTPGGKHIRRIIPGQLSPTQAFHARYGALKASFCS